MNFLSNAIDPQVVLVIAAIAVALLLIRLLFRILSDSLGLLLAIVAIVLVAQYGFGISPSQLGREISLLPKEAIQVIRNLTS
jgi:hypothetical protein